MSRYCNACPTVLADSEATPTCMAYIELQWQLEKCRKSPPKQRIEKANVNERKQAKKKWQQGDMKIECCMQLCGSPRKPSNSISSQAVVSGGARWGKVAH